VRPRLLRIAALAGRHRHLIAFLLLSSESYLATYTLSRFQLSQGIFGPTEIRILLVLGNLALLRSPYATLFEHRMLLFDLAGTIAAICIFATAISVTIRHSAQLYRQEPLP
jgi:archaetidylinositol phosphate synthase